MVIRIGRYDFKGPFETSESLLAAPGVYVILDQRSATCIVLDVGESYDVKTRVEKHERRGCWKKNSRGTWEVAVLYTPNMEEAGRLAIERELRDLCDPPCGKR